MAKTLDELRRSIGRKEQIIGACVFWVLCGVAGYASRDPGYTGTPDSYKRYTARATWYGCETAEELERFPMTGPFSQWGKGCQAVLAPGEEYSFIGVTEQGFFYVDIPTKTGRPSLRRFIDFNGLSEERRRRRGLAA